MKKFLIAEAEKARILGMHYNAMGKTLVNEQLDNPAEFRKAGISSVTEINPEDVKEGKYSVYFSENTNDKDYFYTCAANPNLANQPWNKAGAIYDPTYKITNDPFVLSNTPEFKAIMARRCKVVFDYLAQQKVKNTPQAQVAGATTSNSGISAEKQKQIDAALKAGKMTKKVDPTTSKTTYYSTGKGAFTVGMMNINMKNGEDITRMIID